MRRVWHAALRRLTATVDARALAWFRALYCTALAAITLVELYYLPARYGRLRVFYGPIQLVRAVGVTLPSRWITTLLGCILIAALLLAALGRWVRATLGAALVSFVAFFAICEGWLRAYPTSPSVSLHHNLHPWVLLFLLVAPGVGACRLVLTPRPHWARERETVPAWPFYGVELALALAYFGACYAKLRDTGLSWADGYNLQTYLLERFSNRPRLLPALWLAQHHTLCLLLSVGSLALEGLFWTVLIWPLQSRVRWLYVAGGLSFHVMSWLTMDIWQFLFSYCAAYLVFVALAAGEPQRARPAPADPAAAVRAPATLLAAVGVVMGIGIVGGINWWPLCDWSAYSTRSDWRTQADITRCAVLEPGRPEQGCFGAVPELGQPVALHLGPGAAADSAARDYMLGIIRAPRPPGLSLRLTVREYVTTDGRLQPRFATFVVPF
jgi:hypothetical protein